MPTTTVNATYQGYVRNRVLNYFDWVTDVRDAVNGVSAVTYTSNTSTSLAIEATGTVTRLGSDGICSRTFLFFDLSSVSGMITSATLSVLGFTPGNLNPITVKSKDSAWFGTNTLSNSDFSAIDFSTPYSSGNVGWSTTGYNDFVLNATAISDMDTYRVLNIAVIDADYDYSGSYPPFGTVQQNGVEFLDSTSPIKLTVVTSTVIEPLSISPLLVNKINGVSFNNISKVIGVG